MCHPGTAPASKRPVLPPEPGVESGRGPGLVHVLALAHRYRRHSRGPAKPNERATGLGAAICKEAPDLDASTAPRAIARARNPWSFLNGARARRKTKRGIAALGGAKSHVRSLYLAIGALPGPKGGISDMRYHRRKKYST